MSQKSIKFNFLYNILLQVSKVIFPLITAPYVARVLEPEGVGLFNFANTYANYFALFAALGVPFYGIREIAKVRDDIESQTKFVSEIISLLLVTTILCVAIYLGTLLLIPQLNENFLIFILSALCLYITPFRIDWYFQGKEEFGYITMRSLVIKVVSIACLFIFVHEKSDLINYVIINAACTTINELWNYIKLYKTGVHPYLTLDFKKHLKPLLVLFSSSVAISIYTILDTLMLGFMTDYNQVGYYNSATNISKSILPIATSLAAVVMPRMSYYTKTENWEEIKRLLKKSLDVVSFLCFPLMMGVIVIAPTFVPLFFGDKFVNAILPLQVVIGVVTAIGFNNLLGIQVLIGLGKDKLFLNAVLVGTFSNFFLNLLLIPYIGAVGAAIASVTAETLILFYEVYLVRKHTQIRFSGYRNILMCLIVSLFFIPIEMLTGHIVSGWGEVILFFVLGTSFYILATFMLKNPAVMLFVEAIKKKINR